MEHFNVHVVVHGQTAISPGDDGIDPYEYPKTVGKFVSVDSNNSLTTQDIIERIIKNRLEYEERNRKKQLKIMIIENLKIQQAEKDVSAT